MVSNALIYLKSNNFLYVRTHKLDCPMFIPVRVDRSQDCMVITKFQHEHNHETSESIFQHYPENKSLTAEELGKVKKMVNLKVKTNVIAEKTRNSTCKAVTNKDIHNLRAKIGNISNEEYLRKELLAISDSGTITQILTDDDDDVIAIFVQTEYMRKVFTKFPKLCFLDGTYKTNDFGMPLYTIMVEDGNGVSVPVCHFLVTNESATVLEKAFKCFVSHNEVENVKVFLIDKDIAKVMTIQKLYRRARQRCFWLLAFISRPQVRNIHRPGRTLLFSCLLFTLAT